MNAEIISETSRRTLAGDITFPEVVQALSENGVEFYHVDYLGLRKTFYGGNSQVAVTPITYENLPPVARDFDLDGLRANILDSQTKNQPYRSFTRRAMEAGVQGYFAFLRGGRVTYLGRQGDSHTEWFPDSARQP